jgi:hypothetical protein
MIKIIMLNDGYNWLQSAVFGTNIADWSKLLIINRSMLLEYF